MAVTLVETREDKTNRQMEMLNKVSLLDNRSDGVPYWATPSQAAVRGGTVDGD